ncbi:hypothetical protein FQA39_LY14906 [Lamprigera yunnana]|nr:hypothetical protein FQA39_LY14906 [Lamprigera yunnana]
MSDEATAPSKRGGRRVNSDKAPEKGENKKRLRKEVKQVESGDEDTSAPKRGRGRPRGSTKKKIVKPKGRPAAGRRGRPKKDEKGKDSGDEDNEENDAGEDEDD